jgi:hypothetical protein
MTGLFIRLETPKGRQLSWYGEPFGRIYRDPADSARWLGEFWDGQQKQSVWEPNQDHIQAAVLCFSKWVHATNADIMSSRY